MRKLGRPSTDTEALTVRISSAWIAAIDDCRRKEKALPSRAEIIRRSIANFFDNKAVPQRVDLPAPVILAPPAEHVFSSLGLPFSETLVSRLEAYRARRSYLPSIDEAILHILDATLEQDENEDQEVGIFLNSDQIEEIKELAQGNPVADHAIRLLDRAIKEHRTSHRDAWQDDD